MELSVTLKSKNYMELNTDTGSVTLTRKRQEPGKADVVVAVVKVQRLGPLEKRFPSKCQHATRIGGEDRQRWGWYTE